MDTFKSSKKLETRQTKKVKAKKQVNERNKFGKIEFQVLFKRYWVYVSLTLILLGIFVLLSPYIFRPWTKYPEALRAEIAWNNFTASFSGVCRESCLASRQSYANIWRPVYRKDPVLQTSKLTEVFSGDNSELQEALIKIVAADQNSDNLPTFFASLLMNENVSAENKRLIVNFFPEAFNDPAWFREVRAQVTKQSLSLTERAYALSLLASYPQADNIYFLKNIILNENNEIILEAAFKVLSAWPNGALALSEVELNEMKDLIINSNLRRQGWRRIWLLSELDSGSSANRELRLKEIAARESLDSISRGLAAEALRVEFSLEINTPEPTAPEWQELYEYL